MKGPDVGMQLARALGSRQAQQELRWMRDALYPKSKTLVRSAGGLPSLARMVERRLAGEPLQYILGTQPFGHIDLLVRPPVLIPRPETEEWTIRLAHLLAPSPDKPARLLDLCTGSGCIPLLLCHLWPRGSLRAVGVDVSYDALQLAKDNAESLNIPLNDIRESNAANSFSLLHADMLRNTFWDDLEHTGLAPFDIVTANPPYIPKNEYARLPRSVRDYEDERALLGDPPHTTSNDGRGLTFYRAIADLIRSRDLIKKGGVAVCEVGRGQSNDVVEMMVSTARASSTEVWKDLWGVDRCVLATWA